MTLQPNRPADAVPLLNVAVQGATGFSTDYPLGIYRRVRSRDHLLTGLCLAPLWGGADVSRAGHSVPGAPADPSAPGAFRAERFEPCRVKAGLLFTNAGLSPHPGLPAHFAACQNVSMRSRVGGMAQRRHDPGAMTVFVALLRAVNVGGTGKLPMSRLKAHCESAGFEKVQTYLASGNAVFGSAEPEESQVRAKLETFLKTHSGTTVGVLVRTASEMAAVLQENPFPQAPGDRTVAIFLNEAPDQGTLISISGQRGEEIRLGRREIYVHYGEGIGASKLRIAAAKSGTARNMNTVARLSEIAAELTASTGQNTKRTRGTHRAHPRLPPPFSGVNRGT